MNATKTTYEETCRQLGFIPDVHFVRVHSCGSIGFTCGKPDEIRALWRACLREGLKPSKSLERIAKSL